MIMKKILCLFAFSLLIACGDKDDEPQPKTYPVDVQFEEYSLEGTGAEWNDLEPIMIGESNLIVIDSDDELQKYVIGDYPKVDFGDKTLILAYGWELHQNIPNNISLQNVSERHYLMRINLHTGLSTTHLHWQKAVLVDRLYYLDNVELEIKRDPLNVPERFDLPEPDDSYYLYYGMRIPLAEVDTRSYIMFKSEDVDIVAEKLLEFGVALESEPVPVVDYLADCDHSSIEADYDDIKHIEELVYCTPYYKTSDGYELGIGSIVYVVFREEVEPDEDLLRQFAQQTNIVYLGASEEFCGDYEFACTRDSVGNAQGVANMLYETGLFESADALTFGGIIWAGNTTK